MSIQKQSTEVWLKYKCRTKRFCAKCDCGIWRDQYYWINKHSKHGLTHYFCEKCKDEKEQLKRANTTLFDFE